MSEYYLRLFGNLCFYLFFFRNFDFQNSSIIISFSILHFTVVPRDSMHRRYLSELLNVKFNKKKTSIHREQRTYLWVCELKL